MELGNQHYDFSNIGFPKEFTDFINDLSDYYKDNNKIIYVKVHLTKDRKSQLMKISSGFVRHSLILVFNKNKKGIDTDTPVKVSVKSKRNINYFTFTKSKILTQYFYVEIKQDYSLLMDIINQYFSLVKENVYIKDDDIKLKCTLGRNKKDFDPKILNGYKIKKYEILDKKKDDFSSMIRLYYDVGDKTKYFDIDSKRVATFTLVDNIKGMYLVFSPDGEYKVIGKQFSKKLDFIE